jgi:hypothetical protein
MSRVTGRILIILDIVPKVRSRICALQVGLGADAFRTAANGINAKMTAQQRRNFLRFLNRHELKQFLVFDDFHKKQPARASMDVLGRVAGRDVESAVSAPGRA